MAFSCEAVNSKKHEEDMKRLKEYLTFIKPLDVSILIVTVGNNIEDLSFEQQKDNIVSFFNKVKSLAYEHKITFAIEPLNSLVNHKGYFLDHWSYALEILKEINDPKVKALYDIYHMQIMDGNISATIKENISYIAHFHSAQVPGRGPLYDGELDYGYIAKVIEDKEYNGYFGLEFLSREDAIKDIKASIKILKKIK